MILDILLIILVICGICLTLYLIFWLKNVGRSVEQVQSEFHEIYEKSLPILDNAQEVSERIVTVTKESETRINEIIDLVNKTKEKFAWIVKSDESQRQLQPAENLVNKIKALSKGISAFFYKLK